MRGAYGDQSQTRVECVEKSPPTFLNKYSTTFQSQHLDVEPDCQSSKDADEELLKTNSAHVDMYPEMQERRLDVRPGDDRTTTKLYEKGDYVEPDEVAREAGAGNAEEWLRGEEEVNQSSEDHVIEGIDYYCR